MKRACSWSGDMTPGLRLVPLLVVLLSLCGLAVAVDAHGAGCPSNGNLHAVYVTTNMGNNILSFDTQGAYLGEVINMSSFPADVVVDKLRAMRMGPGGYLYVTSARGSLSRIFALSGNGVMNHTMGASCTRDYQFTVAMQDAQNPYLDHPYDMVFHPTLPELYVANQNSVTVTKYVLDVNASGAVPAWSPAENLPLTTKVRKDLEEPIKVKSNAGLVVAPWSKAYVVSSVRGIAISPAFPRTLIDGNAPAGWFPTDDPTLLTNYLLVCDLAISTVHVFDLTTGERLFGITVPSPVQVVFPQRYSEPRRVNGTLSYFDVPYIYVTSKKDGMAYMVRFVSPSVGIPGSMVARQAGTSPHQLHHFRLTSPITMHALSGVYEYASRDVLYIADRNGRRIGTYASPFILNDYKTSRGPTAYLGDFIHDLPDQPEFVMAVLLENQQNIPFCYELTVSGSLRYTALCYAGHFWMVLATALAIIIPAIICCRQACFMARNSRKAAPTRETSTSHDLGETLSLLGRTARNYGSTNERSGGDARSAKND